MHLDNTKAKIEYVKILPIFLSISLLLILIDQISKSYVIEYLQKQNGMIVYVTKYLNIVYTWNYGISFGMFSNYYQYSNYFFSILNSIIVLFAIVHYFNTYNVYSRYYSVGLLITISGAMGNVLDRIFRKGVFDFIDIHYEDYYFPAFNFADICITLGTIILVYSIIFCPIKSK